MSGYWTAPEIKFDEKTVDEFNKQLNRYASELGKDMGDIIKQWTGNLALELAKETPPFVDKAASNAIEARRRGERQVKDALMKSVTPASEIFKDEFKNKTLAKYVRRKDYAKLNDALANIPKLRRWKGVPFSEDLHLNNRPVGRFDTLKPQFKMTLDKQKWAQYLKKMQDRVGWMKAGWAVSAKALGKDVPAWIERHIPYARGECKIDFTEDKKEITITNGSPTIKRFEPRYNYTLDWMTKKMFKDIEIQLAYRAKQLQGA